MATSLPAPSPASHRRLKSPRTPRTTKSLDPVMNLTLKTTQLTKKIAREQSRLIEAERRLDKACADIDAKRIYLRDALLAAGNRGGLQTISTSKKKANNSLLLARKEKVAHKLKVKLSSIKASNEGLKHQINNRRLERNQIADSVEELAQRRHDQKANLKKLERTIQNTQERKERVHRSYERLKTKTIEEIERFQEHIETAQGTGAAPLVIDIPKLPAGLGTLSKSTGGNRTPIQNGKGYGRKERVMITDRERPDTAPSKEDQENALEKDVNKAYWVVAKTRMDLQRQSDRRNQLFEAFEKIKTETRVNSLDELLATYVGEEDLNFEMFGAISELNQELEELEAQRTDIQSSFKQLEQEKASQDQGRSLTMNEDDTRQDLQRAKKLKIRKEEEFEGNKAELMKHEEALKNLVVALSADDDNPVVDMLVKNGLTLNNLDTFLALIEGKIHEVNMVSPSNPMMLPRSTNVFADGTRPLSLRKPLPPDSSTVDVDGGEDDTAELAPIDVAHLRMKNDSSILSLTQQLPPKETQSRQLAVSKETALMALS